MTEFLALRSKLFAYKTLGGGEKKCRGVKMCMVKKTLDFDDYKCCLLTNVGQSKNMY